MASELEQKVAESLEEGYSKQEIMEAMRADGFSDQKINQAISKAENDVNQNNQTAGNPGQRENLGSPGEKRMQQNSNSAGNEGFDAQADQMDQSGNDPSFALVMALSIIFPPAAYYLLERTKLAIANFLTLNYLGLGIIASPVHCYMIMNK